MKLLVMAATLLPVVVSTAQRKPKIKGNRAVVEVQEALPAFNAIALNDDLEVILEKSASPAYRVIADDNLIDVLKFKVEDSTLVISAFYKVTSKKKLDITVQYNELKAITVREGIIRSEDILSADELYINTYEAARLQLNASAAVTHLNMEGISSGDFNLDSDSLNITLKDRVDASIYVVGETNHVEMYKNASVRMEGTIDTLSLKVTESANFKGKAFEAAVVKAEVDGTSNARIYAYKNFTLSAKGSPKIYLYGDPKISINEFLDTSELYKRRD